MSRKALPLAALPLLLALLASAPHDGGWAVITLEDLPDHLVAGTPVQLEYTVRQHGQTLRNGLGGKVLATDGDRVVEVTARPGAGEGEYRAELTVPTPGSWTVTIRSQVIPGVDYTQDAQLLPMDAIAEDEAPSPLSEGERGRRLFVAKGCVTCHSHADAGIPRLTVGPDLTGKHYPADYLAAYLADPSIRPPANRVFPMPDLALEGDEIARLTAFLNADRDDGLR